MPVAAIILAAGASSRFGKPKQLLRLEGETLIRRVVRAAQEAGCSPLLVVVGEQRAQIERELAQLKVAVVPNENWREGLGASIRAGLDHVNRAEAVLLLASDQPLVDGPMLRQLLELRRTGGKPIVASAYANTLGIPAVFDESYFAPLAGLRGDEGAKRIIFSHRAHVAEFPLPAAATDIDTPDDFARLGSG